MSKERPAAFAEKILKMLDGTITEGEFGALDRWIAEDPKAGRYYIDVLQICLALSRTPEPEGHDLKTAPSDSDLDQLLVKMMAADPLTPKRKTTSSPRRRKVPKWLALGDEPAPEPARSVAEQERIDEIRRYAQRQLDAFMREQSERNRPHKPAGRGSWDIAEVGHRAIEKLDALTKACLRAAKVTVTCSLVVGCILVAAHYFYTHRIVATVVDSVHAKWGSDIGGTNLRPGWLSLEEGFVQIAFKKGTDVLLQAPCEFELRSSNRMSLATGRIAAKVPKQAAGFAIDTPASTVTDYGTKFGLLVGTKGQSDIHVFSGEVGLAQPHQSGDPKVQMLETGEAATVDRTGSIRRDTTTNRPELFVQELPPEDSFAIPGRRLDLADIIRGGSGFGTGQADSVISAGSGHFARSEEWLDEEWRSAYAPVHQLPYIDGLFVPDGSEGPVIVSSGGHRFSACPDTDGMPRNGFVSAGTYRSGRPFRVDFSQSGEVEPDWIDWSTGERLQNAPLSRNFSSAFDSDFTVAFDRVDTRNRGQVDASVPLHDLLDDDFKEAEAVVMRLQGLAPGSYVITTYHHDPREDSKDSDGTISINVTDAKGPRLVAQRFWQSWGPNPKVVASATFAFESDGREVLLVFKDNNDATHNEAHINGFELDLLEGAGEYQDSASSMPRPMLQGRQFGTRANPAIYMHANVGITFDLESIREALSGARVVAFQAQCGLMRTQPGQDNRPSRAGFWVLVDGEVRFRSIVENPGVGTAIDMALNDHDRFLTLVTTDGGDGCEGDLCFFGNAALKLDVTGWNREDTEKEAIM